MSANFKQKASPEKISDVACSTQSPAAQATPNPRPADWRVWLPISLVVFCISFGLLFFRLGYYPLWGDEADTALFARGIARSGDTLALIGHNLYAYRNGACLTNLRGRYQPPVPYYLAAPFVGANGTGSLWPRIPFAVCGLLSVAFMLYWMSRSRLSTAAWLVFSVALVCNVSFFLFCRQCRYYSLVILLTLLIVYLYLNWRGRPWEYAAIVVLSILLLGSNYLSYAALYAALACDWLFFTRRQFRLKLGQLALLLAPQIIVGMIAVWIYNPLATDVVPKIPGRNLFLDKLTLLWWNIRDLNNGEFCVGILIVAVPFAYHWTRNTWLLRGMIALLSYIFAIMIVTPQPVALNHVADVRYLVPLIPLCIALSSLVIVWIARNWWPVALLIAVLVFATNLPNYPLFFHSIQYSIYKFHSRPFDFLCELWSPKQTSIGMVADWVKKNLHKGDTVWVMPDDKEAALMYLAPQPTYAWHLMYPPKKQFAKLPLIHFFQMGCPDYFLIFGPERKLAEKGVAILKKSGIEYKLVFFFDIYWNEMIRPELMWRSPEPITKFNRNLQAVYVYKHISSTSEANNGKETK